MDPTSLPQQSLVNAVPHILMVHWCLLWSGREFQDLTKSGLTLPHIIDVWHDHSGWVTCKGLSDLGIGPNKPTVTIIGEFSAPYCDGALMFTLIKARISGSDKNLAWLFDHTSLMSDMVIVTEWLVKGCQTLVLDPTSLLQQSLVNTVPHTVMVHWYILGSGQEFQDLTKIWPNFLTTHHWCLTWS